jgi:predicted permease
MSLWSRIRNAFRSEAVNRDLEDELRSHREEALENGRDPRAFGNALLHQERALDIKLLPWLDSLRADIVFGWRQLNRRRSVNLAAILSLALGIGSCTAAFRLIDALLWRPLPVADPGNLYSVAFTTFDERSGRNSDEDYFDYSLYRSLRQAVHGKAELIVAGAANRRDLTFGSDDDMEKAYQQFVSGNAFTVFGLKPAVGRLLTPADDQTPGAHPYAVLSHHYWSARFGRDPNVVGKTFHLGDQIYEIVGVCEAGFTGTEPGIIVDLFLPAMMNTRAIEARGWSWFRILTRPYAGVSPEQLRDPLQAAFAHRRAADTTDWDKSIPKERREKYVQAPIVLHPASSGVSRAQSQFRLSLLILGCVVLLVLLIACANVANLLTAQAMERAREMALRVSIGAGRARLVQLVLVEGALLALLSTALGALFAWWAAPFVISMINPQNDPVRLVLGADWRVLLFSAALALAVTLLFGLAPALQASAVKPAAALKGGEDPQRKRRLTYGLIAAQVAFCFVVQFAAGLFVATFQRLSDQPTGFKAEGVLTLETLARQPRGVSAWEAVTDELRVAPGVESIAMTDSPFMSGATWGQGLRVNGILHLGLNPYARRVSPGFFRTMNIAWIDGRDFRPGETRPGTAIVNEEFARQFFAGSNPVGKTFEIPEREGGFGTYEIVGYVANIRYRDLREPIRPIIFFPFNKQETVSTILVRTASASPLTLGQQLRKEVSQTHRQFRVSNISTQTDFVRRHTIRERLLATLSLFFAAVAMVLAAVGIYGVLNYAVIRRTREIGIRLAFGAPARSIAGLISREVLSMVLLGGIAGVVFGGLAVKAVEPILYQVTATDLSMLVFPASLILISAILATAGPIARAIYIDPAQSLRSE